jgi:zinc protease
MDRTMVARDNPRPMKTRSLFVFLTLAALVGSTASCQCSRKQQEPTEAPPEPKIVDQSFKLANGLDVNLLTGPCGESTTLVVLLDVGIDHDPAGRSGMAQLAGRILATTAPQGRAERSVEVGSDYILYSVVVSGEQVLDELNEVAGWMSDKQPLAADLNRERTRLLEDLGKLQGNDAALTATSMAEEAVRPSRGNGKRKGIATEVEAITLGELQTYWQGQIKPANAHLAIAGKFEASKAKERIDASFASLAGGSPPTLRNPAEATVRGTLVMGDKPTHVAIAIPAPELTDPDYAPFLVQAARLLEKPAEARTWQVEFDPLRRPDLLLVSGPVGQTEQPEPTAGRMRDEMAKLLAAPLTSADMAKAKERFHAFLNPSDTHPETCAKDARTFAIARLRGAQLKLDAPALRKAIDETSKEQLAEVAKLFEVKQSAAVCAGGAIR